ncbi:filamentous hemagglutinin N-terminal domain-containing protein [Rhizobium rhizogenes]|uniref:two-partner secretion domain-containing protein n=4 Tax=Rhizobium rhizogenes TaxID=359 RepID=UPI001AAE7274|nr:hemagglutinin repeat-containing protein [Rhizobium rhizogenes]QTG07578.1 filamentous hemagglutinin N-terminal domain-containing protein [Rhizobium rhizogenes]
MGKHPRQGSGKSYRESTASQSAAGDIVHRLVRLAHKALALTLSSLLVLQPTIANAQSVSASTAAPTANQPGVGAAPNGVPLIDIVTPNGAGLSHNKFSDFNVGTPGLILNNFKGEVGTSNLGGATPGNPNLNSSSPASVILNEVTGGNRSALNGPTEVFGSRADVIIANPNGLTCSGCGFINTPHATLTTGVPNIGADGSLTGFTVNGGDVTFEGAGANLAAAPGAVDLFDVVARNIHVNAPIYGKTLRLTGGASQYNYATGEATALTATSGTPEYAIDGSALGAMQADRIKVVVTEKGAGVKMSGDMAANAGELSLSADGKISIGNASGSQGVTITSKRQVTAAKVTSKQKVAVQADQGITLQSVAADSDIVLASGTGLLSVSGDVNSGTTVQMSSGGGIAAGSVTAGNGAATLSATSGNIAIAGAANSTGDLNLTATAGSISAGSLLSNQNIALTAGLDVAVSGNVLAQGNVSATGRSISTGMTVSGINIAATSADPNGNVVLGSAGNLSLTATGGNIATGNLLSAGSLSTSATGNMTAGGIQTTGNFTATAASLTSSNITSHGAITVNAATNVSGQILGSSNVLISGAAIQAGAIASGVDFAATNAAGGTLAVGPTGTLDLTATTGNIVVGTLLSAGNLNARSALLQANTLTGHGNVGIDGGVRVANQLLGAGDITINGNANGVSAGLLASGVDFAATKAAGGNIVVANSGDLTVNDSLGAIQAGTILAAGAINTTGQTITADTITGHQNITLSGATAVTGQILGAGNVSVSGPTIAADAIVSGVDIAATDAAGGRITLGPTTTGTGNLTLAAAGLLSADTLLSAGNLDASGANITADNISAHGNLTLDGASSTTTASGRVDISGQILGAGNVLISGQSLSAQTVVAGLDFDATNGAGGNIVLGQAGDLTVSVNGAVTAPTIQAAGVIDISGASVAADAITGHKDLTLSSTAAAGVDVTRQVLGGGSVDISGASIKAGTIVSGVDFARTAAANGNIVQASSGDLTLASSGSLDAGTLLSAGDLSAAGSTISADSVTAHGDVALDGATTVAGQILGAGNVLITGQSLSAQTVVAGIDFDATNAASGNIVLGQAGDLTIAVNGALAAPTLQAAGAIDAHAASISANAVTGHKGITLSGATGGVDINGQVLGGGDISVAGSSIKAGTIVSGVDFARTAAANGTIVQASSGDLTLASSGSIDAGTLLSAGDLSAAGSTVSADSVTAHGDVALDGATTVAGQILGAGNVLITGQSLSAQTVVAGIDFDATNAASGNIVLGQAGDLTIAVNGALAAPTLQAAGVIDAHAASISANAVTGHKGITLSGATGGVDIDNQVLGGGDISVSGSSIKAGTIVSGVDFAATAAADGNIVLASSGDLNLASTGNIDTATLLSAGDLKAAGSTVTANAVTAHGAVTLDGATTVNGQILGAGNVLITGQSLSAQTIISGIDFSATNASGGDIVLGQAGDLTVSVNGVVAAPTLQAAGAIDVSGTSITADAVTGHKDITLSSTAAGGVDVSGQILGGNDVAISGQSITAGTIVSGVDFARTAAANGNIVQTVSGDVSLISTGDITVGTLLSAGDLTTDGANLKADSLTAHGDATLKASGTGASGRVDISGQVLSAGDLAINANSLNAGLLVSGVDFAATDASGGNIKLASSGDTDLTISGNATAGTILSAGDVTAKAANLTADSITSHGNVAITATGVAGNVEVNNQILAAGNLTINGGSITAPVLISGIDFAATNAAGGNIVLGSSATSAGNRAGSMNLTASGNIAGGTILSAGDLTAKAADLTADSITSHGNVGITGDVAVSNQILSAGNLTINGGSISAPVLISGIDFAATNAAGGSIVLGSSGGMNLTASAGIATQTMLSAGVIEASGSTITANAVTGHGDITLAGSSSVKVTGQLLGGNDVSLSGQTVQVGQAITGVDFATTAQSSNGAIALGSSGDLDINAGSATAGTLIVAGNLDVLASAFTGGNITSHGAVSIGSSANPGAIAINGQLLGGSNVSITGSGISGNVIVAGVDFAATSQSATGNIVLGQAGDLTLKATSGNVTSNSLMAAGSITANASNNVSANAVAHRDLTITVGNAITLTGQSLASRNANLSARSMTIDTLVSGVDFAATNAAAGGSLMLQRSGTMTLAASNGSINANSLLSGGNLAASATQNIGYSSLQSLGNATLTAPGAIAYTSTTRVGGNLTLNTGALDLSGTRGSRIAGGGSLIVNASSANLSGSNLVFGGLALNLSGAADLSNAQVSTVTNAGGSGDIAISAAGGLTTNANTELLAAHDLTLTLPSLGNSGQLAAANNVTFNIAGDFNNTPSGLVFAGNNANLFVGGTLNNNQGALLSGNGLTIAGPGGGQRNGAVVNTAGLIQSGGTMSILTDTLVNTTTSTPAIQRNVQISNEILSPYDVITETTRCATRCNGSGDHDPPTYETVQTIDHLVSQLIAEDQLTAGAGADAKIRAGGNLTINATNLTNSYSSIKSDGDMTLTVAGTLTNDGATLNRTVTTTCDSSTPCQYYPDVGNSDNPNGTRDPSKDLAAGTAVSVQAIGVLSGVIQARGALNISAGAVNNVASNGSIAGQVAIDAAATTSNPLGALNSMTAGGALFNVNAALTGVAANGGATAGSGPSLTSGGPTIGSGPAINGNSLAVAGATSIGGNNLTVTGGTSISGNGVTAAGGPAITGNSLTAGGASINPNSLMGKLTAAIGNSGNLTQILQVNGAQLAALAKPQSGGVGGTVPGQVFLFETRAAFLDVSKFYGSGYFIDRIGYTPETKVPFLGDAYFDNQLVDEQMRQLVGDGLGAGSFVPGNNATDQMKTLLDNGVAYAEANGLALGQALSPEQAANLTESMVIYQTEVVDGASVLVPVVYLSAADRAKTTSAATIAGNTVSIDAGSVDNSGAIAAADGMTINATDIKANGGAFLAGGNMNLNAANGITLAAQTMNIGGQTIVAANGGITAGGSLKVDAGAGSLTLAGTKVTSGGSAQLSGQTVTVGAVKQDNGGVQTLVGTTVTTGGNLSIAGASGVNIIASSAKAGGDLSVLSTNGAVNIISAGVENTVLGKDRLSLAAGGTTTTTTSQTQQGSSLIAGGTMLVSGDQGVLIGGSSLDAGGNLGVVSQNGNIAITASQDETSSSSKTKSGAANDYKSGSSSSTSVTSNGSSITSGNGSVTVQADKGDISVIGSDIDAKGGTATLSAKGDVTIGEATDTASSSSKYGSKKASEATTTAEGSLVSGQTGVSIASTGGNVTIWASDVTAGDATHTADANIQAAGNIVIASGKDTDETTSDSKKSGFLSSSKTHTYTYDETNVGSSISATGNVTAKAGGETVISGSEMAAGGNLSLSGSTVTIMGAEEEHESDKQTKKSGIGVGSGGGFISIYGSHSKTISESSTDNVGSTLTAANGNINLTATAGDLNVIGSSITANMGDVTGIASGNINILPGHESTDSSKDDKRSGFGLQVSASSSGASIGIGAGRFTNKTTQSADTNAVSTITAGNDITLKAGDTFNDQAGQISAGGNVTIFGQNGVNFLSGNDVSNFDQVATSFFAGVSLGVSSGILSAGQSVQNLASKIGNVTDGYSAANAAFAGMKAYDALSSLSDGLNAGNLASISLTAGFTYSKTETSLTTSTPVVPTISASSVDISTNGDFVSRGLQISAVASSDHADDPDNGSVSISANNIDMGGAWASSEASSSSKSAGASIGVSVGVGAGSVTGITPTGSVSAGQSKSSSTSTTPVVSVVSASNGITFTSKGNTTLDNTIFSAGTIIGTVGGDLSIVSTPGTGSQSNSSQSLGFSFTGPTVGKSDDGSPLLTTDNAKTALGGLTLGGVQPGFGKGSGSTSWIDQPSGLYSTGDQTITVGGNTNLAASGLISSDGQVNLDTGTLTWSDFVGSQKYQGYQVDANIDLYSGADANGKTQNNSSAEGKYQLDDVEQSVKATISGSGAPGNITIRNTDQQAALEQSGTTRPVDQINSDPAQQSVITKDKHILLEPYVSVQSAIAVVAAGKTIAEAIGDAFDKLEAAKQITPEENQIVKKVIKYKDDPKMMAGLQTCGEHGEIRHSIFDWLITPAYADAPSCKVKTPDGDTLDLTPTLATLILNQIADRTKQVLAVTSFVTGMGYELLKGGLSAQTQRLDDGTTLTWTSYSFGTTVSTDVPLPGGGSISLSLTLREESDGSFTLIGGQIGSTPMSAADLGDWANMMSRDGKKLVVYNQQSGSGSGDGTTTGGSVATTGSPDPDDDGNGGNQDDDETSVYRGGDKLTVRNIDVKVDKTTGLVQPGRGVSVNTDPSGLEKFGGAHKIDLGSIPDELELIQRGNSATHFEIAPKAPMTMEQFQSLLNQIRLTPT